MSDKVGQSKPDLSHFCFTSNKLVLSVYHVNSVIVLTLWKGSKGSNALLTSACTRSHKPLCHSHKRSTFALGRKPGIPSNILESTPVVFPDIPLPEGVARVRLARLLGEMEDFGVDCASVHMKEVEGRAIVR
jgi:hypothetical protein